METECKTKGIYLLQFEEKVAMNSSVSVDTTFPKNMYPQIVIIIIIIFTFSCLFVDIFNKSRGGLYGCEMLRITHCLDNRLTNGGEVVSPTHRPLYIPRTIIFLLLVLISVRSRVNPRA
jgi:hypothetical protein